MNDECSRQLDSLEELLIGQIRKVTAKNDITPAELDNMNKALCAMETIRRIKDGDLDSAYSGDSYRFSGTMPRMSHDRHMSHGRMPYSEGYSRHSINDRMVDALEKMYDEAGTDHERRQIDKYIRMLRDE